MLPIYPALPGLNYNNSRTAQWNSLKQVATSGRETRLALWSYPRYQYELDYGLLRNGAAWQEWQTLVGFYNLVSGAGGMFQYNDPNDNSGTAQSIGTGDGTTTTFQLLRSLGGFTEPVFAPNGTPTITVAGVATLAFTVGSTGKITFTTAPAAGAALTWSGSFYWLCRFDDDTLATTQVMSTFWEAKKVKFSTVKL